MQFTCHHSQYQRAFLLDLLVAFRYCYESDVARLDEQLYLCRQIKIAHQKQLLSNLFQDDPFPTEENAPAFTAPLLCQDFFIILCNLILPLYMEMLVLHEGTHFNFDQDLMEKIDELISLPYIDHEHRSMLGIAKSLRPSNIARQMFQDAGSGDAVAPIGQSKMFIEIIQKKAVSIATMETYNDFAARYTESHTDSNVLSDLEISTEVLQSLQTFLQRLELEGAASLNASDIEQQCANLQRLRNLAHP